MKSEAEKDNDALQAYLKLGLANPKKAFDNAFANFIEQNKTIKDTPASIDHKTGIIKLHLPKFGKVQQALYIYMEWLHEVGFEMCPDAHPSWKGYTVRQFKKIIEIKKTMTDSEREEFERKRFGNIQR